MSNELKRVQERLFKKPETVELSAEKVELGLAAEIQKDYEKYSKQVINGNSKADAVVTAAKAASDLYKQALSDYAVIQKQLDYVSKQAGDLGVDVPPSLKRIQTEMNSTISYMEGRIKRLADAMNVTQK